MSFPDQYWGGWSFLYHSIYFSRRVFSKPARMILSSLWLPSFQIASSGIMICSAPQNIAKSSLCSEFGLNISFLIASKGMSSCSNLPKASKINEAK